MKFLEFQYGRDVMQNKGNLHRQWKYDEKPPNQELVEIILRIESKIIKAYAVWGNPKEGILPHWESEDRNIHYPIDNITAWRYLN
jgi:hypothetical protein